LADVAFIVLAAGAGRRFGGPKQIAPLAGRPLLQHVLDAAPGPLTVVLGAHAGEIRATVDLEGVDVVVCEDWEEGQAASLRAGVAAAGPVDAVVVLLGDMPFVTRQVVVGALDHLTTGWDAVRTLYRGVPGHPVVLGRRVLARVPELRGDIGARDLLRLFRVREWEAGQLCDPVDVDTPEQLEAIAR
jgi:CTP:molybdopterin cytidylyltransferase MocA